MSGPSNRYEDVSLASASFVRPPTYYNDGPFEANSGSSEDGEEEVLLEKHITDRRDGPGSPGIAEIGVDDDGLFIGRQKRPSSLRWLIISLGGLLFLAVCIGTFAAHTYSKPGLPHSGNKHMTMDHIFNGTFQVQSQSLHWVPEAGDGVYSILHNGIIQLIDLKTNTTRTLVDMHSVVDQNSQPINYANWKLSPSMKYILIKADYVKQWRHSSYGNYYVHAIDSGKTWPITKPTFPPTTAYAAWSPTGEAVAFVSSNDLYVVPSPSPTATPIRITKTGTASVFNGVPDWVYEEEVFSGPSALWWSPTSKALAFLTFDETLVDEYKFPIYNPTWDNNEIVPYPSETVMKYPKPGYNNPLVSLRIFDLTLHQATSNTTTSGEAATSVVNWAGRQNVNDSVIAEVVWVGNDSLLIKEVNRAANTGSVILFEGGGSMLGKIVRVLGAKGEQGDDGWIDSEQFVYPLPAKFANDTTAYLDIVPSKDGYNHIALFSPADSGKPYFLTSGEWEVTGGIQGIDVKMGLVYFQAASSSGIERHIYSVPLPSLSSLASFKALDPTPMTDPTTPSFYSASFSPEAGFYLLNYKGPNIPWQRVIQSHNESFTYILEDNDKLNKTMMLFEAPVITHSTIESDGYVLNVKEIRPARMDDSGRTKYAVLFRVYGGPSSQMVSQSFERDWHHYLACDLQYIIVIVDGRGTGFKGRKLRNPVRNNLGYWETVDQINAAKIWAAKQYVDAKRIGIWGWSYGGFMSSKVVEAGAGIHSLAMAVAPVTSWRLYDSIYTERYMNLPAVNPGGYVNASISNVTAFNNFNFLLAHGSGDDNVHFSNSAHLLDMFTGAQVRGFRFRMFTDSDHNINRRGAYREVFEFLTAFLVEKWGKGARRRSW